MEDLVEDRLKLSRSARTVGCWQVLPKTDAFGCRISRKSRPNYGRCNSGLGLRSVVGRVRTGKWKSLPGNDGESCARSFKRPINSRICDPKSFRPTGI